MPAGSFHPGLCTNTTPARAARSFLGGTHVCSPGKEKNSKKRGNVRDFAWATLGRRLGPEQSLGARQDQHGAASCGEADGRFCDEQVLLGVFPQGREKRENDWTSVRNLCFFGNYRQENGGKRTGCFWKLKRCLLACLLRLILENLCICF